MGSAGLLGVVENGLGLKIIFGLLGIVLASIFVTVPFVIREVEPVLHELGTDQEEAAATLGATWWQTFWRITLPSIRWGLTYGVVLTVARTLGSTARCSWCRRICPENHRRSRCWCRTATAGAQSTAHTHSPHC